MLTAIWFFHRFVLFGIAITYMTSGILSRLAYSFRRKGPLSAETLPAPETNPQEQSQ